jgi:hypothetical protein
LVHRRVSGEEVVVLLSIYIPNMHPLAPMEHHREWGVVVRPMLVLSVDVLQEALEPSLNSPEGTMNAWLQCLPT